ncbi:MAG: cell division protein ZapA [Dysgonamonadaceae bacterium]|jgi:cell division protein ZapA|nr:cell division protein ZapA [Dysgonamonadaceae bacterium]
MGDDKMSLTLEVDGRKLPPLKIKGSDEGALRAAAKKINAKITSYRIAFGQDPALKAQDYMAMAAIQLVGEKFAFDDRNDTKPFEDKIHSLINELDTYLKKQP